MKKVRLTQIVVLGTCLIALAFFAFSPRLSAQQGQGQPPIGGGPAPAAGTDMWTSQMAKLELFIPHADNCDSVTEAFVQIAPTGEGYCIEKDQRPAEQKWELARHTCLQDDKRLPEAAEWKFASSPSVFVRL